MNLVETTLMTVGGIVYTFGKEWLIDEMQKNMELFIEDIKKDDQIDKYDEANTKSIIINRILGILGWNIYDEVELEYRTHCGKVDYTLKGFRNKSFLEAKKACLRLYPYHEYQLLSYAKNEQINLAILSNGLEWRFYLPCCNRNYESII